MSQSQTSSVILSISSNSEIENSSDSLSSTSSKYEIQKPFWTDSKIAAEMADGFEISVGSDSSVEICDSEVDVSIEYKIIESSILKKRTFKERLQEKEDIRIEESRYKDTTILLKDFEDEILEEKP